MSAPANFVIVPHSMGRCGSTWLCDLLDSHPQICCLSEVFNPGLIPRHKPILDHLGATGDPAFLYEGIRLHRPGHDGYGCKIFKEQLSPPDLRKVMVFVDRIILIDRENLTQALVSQLRAERNAAWATHDTKPPLRDLHVPVDKAEEWLNYTKSSAADFEKRIEDIDTPRSRVTYEDLCRDHQAAIDALVTDLGLPAAPTRSSLQKQNKTYDFVSNREELNEAFGAEFGYLDS